MSNDLQIVVVLALVAVVFISFIRERLPADVTAMLAFSALLAGGVLTASEALSVFSNSGPITVACMFVLSAALERTGIIDRMGALAIWSAQRSPLLALVATALAVMLVSAFINNTPVVVILTPVVIVLAKSVKLAPSRLLIPLSFVSIFGGTTTLIGTSTNLLVNGVVETYGYRAISMFEMTLPGLVMAGVGIAYMAVFGRWLLPDRVSPVVQTEPRSFLSEVSVPEGSSKIGLSLAEAGLKPDHGTEVVDLLRGERSLRWVISSATLQAGDRIVLRSKAGDVMGLREARALAVGAHEMDDLNALETQPTVVMEGVVGPQSRLIGYRIADLNFRRLYNVYILAVHRQGVELREDFSQITLAFGDILLLEGPADGLRRLFERRVLVNLTEPRDRPFRRDKAPIAVAAILTVMVLAAFEVLPIEALALIAASAVVASGCLTAEDAYQAIQWRILLLIFGMLGLGLAMEKTGAASLIVASILPHVSALGPLAVLAMVFLLTSVLTELISNNASAILITPIAIALAVQLGVDPRPFIMAVLFAASASFATPIGYQTNTFVYSAGGYRFTDFLRIGLPLNAIMWASATFLIPIFWPF
jgi:di/tricarboxylate transporter